MEKNIPDEIKKQIDDYAFEYEKENPSSKYTFKDVLSGAEFGYSLASKALSDANKEIERLKGLIDAAYFQGRRDIHYGKQKTMLDKFKTANNL